jgi:hypothetical protein
MLLVVPGGRGEDELHFGDDDESIIITMIVLQLLLRVDDGELFDDDLEEE